MRVCSGMCVLEHVWYTVRDIYLRGTLGVSMQDTRYSSLSPWALFSFFGSVSRPPESQIYTQRGQVLIPLCSFLITNDIENPQLSFGEFSFLHCQYWLWELSFKLTLIVREKTQRSNNQGVTSFNSESNMCCSPLLTLLWDTTQQDDGIGFCLKRISKANGERR